jgi:tRNA pseudouridine13 synthase
MTDRPWRRLEEMPRASGPSLGTARMRVTADDFQVDEVLGFEPDGDGEHLLVHLRKRDTNTTWLASRLARLAGVPARDVSYAGLKDRHAVTTQWFSLRLAGRPEPDWSALDAGPVEVLGVHRHRRKLRRGALRGNRFRILLRDVNADRAALETRLQQLRSAGMPNYFGEQRFGHDYQNLTRFDELFGSRRQRIDRQLRGLLISAVRSQLFNEVLARRIGQGSWSTPLVGDYFMLDGSRSGFPDDSDDPNLAERCRQQDIHPTGPLWGRGMPQAGGETVRLEHEVLAPFGEWRERLEHVGLSQERRPLRVRLDDLQWRFEDDTTLQLDFFLPAGTFATVLLRELMALQEAPREG